MTTANGMARISNGLDVRQILLAGTQYQWNQFSLLKFLRGQTELCRVLVRATNFPYLRRYPMLVLKNPVAEKEGVAGYEIALNYNGVGVRPDAARGVGNQKPARIQLLSVNETEAKGQSLPPPRGPAPWALGTGERRVAGSGVVDLLAVPTDIKSLTRDELEAQFKSWQRTGLSRHPIARMALFPPRHQLGRHDQFTQGVA